MADHKAARKIARVDVAECDIDSTPYLLAAAYLERDKQYLELRELAKVASQDADDPEMAAARKAIRKALEE